MSVAPTGRPTTKDPWEWDVDEVVHAFCKVDGIYRTKFPILKVDFPNFETALRDNQMHGQFFLLDVEQSTVRDIFGIAAIGAQAALMRIVQQLRHQSPGYQAFITQHPEHIPLYAVPSVSRRVGSISNLKLVGRAAERALSSGKSRRESTSAVPDSTTNASNHTSLPASAAPRSADSQDAASRRPPSSDTHLLRNHEIIVDESGRKRKRLTTLTTNVSVYLGYKVLSYDDMLYGDTRVGDEIKHNVDVSVEMQAWKAARDQSPFTMQVAFELGAHARSGDGRQIHVNHCMKAYLRSSHPSNPTYVKSKQGEIAVGIRPFHYRKTVGAWKPRSMTVIHLGPNPVATRESSASWQELLDQSGDASKTEETASWPETSSMPLLSTDPWQALFEKYESIKEDPDNHALPLYGDSGSENDYDSETLEEMQAEKEEEVQASSSTTLTATEILEAIAQAETDLQSRWVDSKRPKLEGSSYQIWNKAYRNGGIPLNIAQLKLEASRLEQRSRSLKKHIAGERWVRSDDVRKQCEALQNTIFDVCSVRFKIQILELKTAPERPPPSQLARPRQRKPRLAKVAVEEEDLTDEDQEDWIEDDSEAVAVRSRYWKDESSPPANGPVQFKPAVLDRNGEHPFMADVIDLTFEESSDGHVAVLKPVNPVISIEEHASSHHLAVPSRDGSLVSHTTDQIQKYLDMSVKDLKAIPQSDVSQMSGTIRAVWLAANNAKHITSINKLLTMKQMDLERFSAHVLEGLKALKARQYKQIRSLAIDDTRPVLELARWQFAWSVGFWQHSHGTIEADDLSDGPSQAEAMNALIGAWPPKDIEQFFVFVLDRIDHINDEKAKKLGIQITKEGPDSETRPYTELSDDDSPIDGKPRKRGRPRRNGLTGNLKIAPENPHKRQQRLHAQLSNYRHALDISPTVNVMEDGSYSVKINSHIGRLIQPHQLEGVRFLWREIVMAKEPQGCLLAHSMGTGKTLQVVAFLNTLAEASKSDQMAIRKQIHKKRRAVRYLVVPPPSLVSNWYDEFLKWLPVNLGGIGKIYVVWPNTSVALRRTEIERWVQSGGVLLISSHLFRDIVTSDGPSAAADSIDLRRMSELLCNQTSVAVVDEAQELRNVASKLAQAVRKLRTRSRIGLTGSPLANSLNEYFSLIDWTSPGYLGTYNDFKERYERPITDGLYADATTWHKRRALKRLSALTRDLEPKVHRADNAVLDRQLHGKTEYLIRVPLTSLQRQCYNLLVTSIRDANTGENIGQTRLWAYMFLFRLLCNHPSCLHDHLSKKQEQIAPTMNEILSSIAPLAPELHRPTQTQSEPNEQQTHEQPEDFVKAAEALAERPSILLGASSIKDQLGVLMKQSSLQDLGLSNKTVLIQQILQLSRQSGEKILVFSHSLNTLNFVVGIVESLQMTWTRIDGAVNTAARNDLARYFNEGPVDVCVISTTAGGTGLNLYGASRVIIIDEWYNPMHEQQAIGRAYRIGQTKQVFVYHLMTAGTYEETMQNLSAFKSNLASRVMDRKKMGRQATKDVRVWLRPVVEDGFRDIDRVRGTDHKVLDQVLGTEDSVGLLQKIYSIEIGNSYLVDQTDQLTPQEQQEADNLLDEDRQRRTGLIVAKHVGLVAAPSIPTGLPLMQPIAEPLTPSAIPPSKINIAHEESSDPRAEAATEEPSSLSAPQRSASEPVIKGLVGKTAESQPRASSAGRHLVIDEVPAPNNRLGDAQPEPQFVTGGLDDAPEISVQERQGSGNQYTLHTATQNPVEIDDVARVDAKRKVSAMLEDLIATGSGSERPWLPLEEAEKSLLVEELEANAHRLARDLEHYRELTGPSSKEEIADCVNKIRERVEREDEDVEASLRARPLPADAASHRPDEARLSNRPSRGSGRDFARERCQPQ